MNNEFSPRFAQPVKTSTPSVGRLLVFVADRLTDLAAKGELTARYYNPEDVFARVDIVSLTDDRPAPAAFQTLVGRAELAFHNLPAPSFVRTLGWRPARLHGWAAHARDLGARLRPDVVRAYGTWLHAFAAAEAAAAANAPLVVSVHANPDDERRRLTWRRAPKLKLFYAASEAVERASLARAALVLPAYDSARAYAVAHGAERVQVIHNAVNHAHITPKADYRGGDRLHVVSTGRQIDGKFSEHVVRACGAVGAQLTMIGDGPMHDRLRAIAAEARVDAVFVRALPNAELCERLHTFDVYAAHCAYAGISKTTIEAALAGLPVVVTRDPGQRMTELEASPCRLVPNTTAAFTEALRRLQTAEARAAMGAAVRHWAVDQFDPTRMEHLAANVYRALGRP